MKQTSSRSRTLLLCSVFGAGLLCGTVGTGITAAVRGSSVFDDVRQGAYYDDAVGELYNDGIIKGYEGTDNFGPDDYVTRGQVAVMLKRFRDDLNGVVDDDTDDDASSSSRSSRSSSSSTSSTASSKNPRGTIRFSTDKFSINENQKSITISVMRVGGDQGEVSVEYEVRAGTATAGSDFEEKSGTLTFEDEETSVTFTIQLSDDSSSEGDETILLTLKNPEGGASLGTPSSATLTIDDNEASTGSSSISSSGGNSSAVSGKGTLSFGAATYMVNEADGSITITVVRTGGSSGTVGVNYATSNGSAQANADYAPASGTLSFGAGETSKSFTISVVDDSSLNGNATFNVALSSPSGGAGLGESTAVVSIHDNENTAAAYGTGSLKFSKSEYDVVESDGEVTLTVQRVGGTRGTVTVNYATVNGSAFSGADYTSVSGTLTFLPGESAKTITVPIVDDNNAEAQDNFYVNLSSPSSNTSLLTPDSATVTISN